MDIVLEWQEDLRFQGRFGNVRTAIDGHGEAGASPVSLLLQALAGCAGSDVVEILRKGREELEGLEVRLSATRREEPPRWVTAIRMGFHLEGPVSRAKAERAVRLSFETYCSVWHTLRPEVELDWSVHLADQGDGAS